MKRTHQTALLAVLGAMLPAHVLTAAQEVAIWCGCDSGPNTNLWTVPGNWDAGIVPINGVPTTYWVLFDNGSAGISTASVNASLTIDKLDISDGDTLVIDNTRTLTLVGSVGGDPSTGVITNDGTLLLDSSGNTTALVVNGDTLFLNTPVAMGGVVRMGPSTENYIYGLNGTETIVNNFSHRIDGAGQIGINITRLENYGEIVATQATVPLVVDPNATTMINDGTLQSVLGATLRLNGGTYDNTTGQIIPGDNSFVEYSSAYVMGGLLNAVGDGTHVIIGAGCIFEDVTKAGIMNIPNNTTARFVDTLSNTGDLNLQSTVNSTLFYVDNIDTSGVTLSGGGTINMSDATENYILAWNGGEIFTNVNNTIRGSGHVGNNALTIDNQVAGSIIADQPTVLEVNPGGGGMTNAGTMRAENGGTLRLRDGAYDNTIGSISAIEGSTLEFSGADVVNTGSSIDAVDASTVNLLNSFGIHGGAINGDPGSVFTASGATGVIEDVSFNSVLNLSNNTSVRFMDGIVNSGVINLSATVNNALFYVDNNLTSGVTLSGGGTINLSDDTENYFLGWNGNETLTNVDNTIRGSGRFGNNSIAIDNQSQGIIIADQPTTLIVDPSSAMTNDGVLRAANGGTLRLEPGGIYENANGVIEALQGSLVEISTTHINGGLLHGEGAPIGRFEIVSGNAYLQDVTLDAVLDIPNNRATRVADDIVNSGEINLGATVNNAILYVDNIVSSGVTLTGGGTISLSDDLENYIMGWNGTETLTISDQTIRGSGRLGNNITTLVNGGQGRIIADQPTRLIVDPGAGGLTSSGTVTVEAGSEMDVINGMTQTGGLTDVRGTFDMQFTQTLALQGGALRGDGDLLGHVSNTGGTVQPGNSAGELFIDGNYVQTTDGYFDAEIGGYIPGSGHDVLTTTGTATLGGTLWVEVIDGFQPKLGTVFTVLTADEVIGTFDQVIGAGDFQVLYRTHTVQIVVNDFNLTCEGDLDFNGTVGVTDLLALLAAWGTADPVIDFAPAGGDGVVSVTDLLALLAAWGDCT